MSETSVPADPSVLGSPAFGHRSRNYTLSSDLAKLCLPSEYRDSNRLLAWVNSICLLFLLIGLVGLKAPKVVVRPLSEPQEVVPVVFTPPEEQPKIQPEAKQDEPEPDKPLDTPQVATVVAAADPSTVAFAVPVEGAVVVAPARFATAPPPINTAPPKPTFFDPNANSGGNTPPPEYPIQAQRRGYQGTVTIEFIVDGSGAITSAKVQKGSGYPVLDEAALRTVKDRWRFPPGQPRYYYVPLVFNLQ
jgi:TonB family protein